MANLRTVSKEEGLSRDLQSLRIDRDASGAPAATARGYLPWLVAAATAATAISAFVFRDRASGMFPAEVELGALTLVSPQQAEVNLVATGYVYAQKRATVAPRIVGRIAKIYVREGEVVKAGQLLAELDALDVAAQGAQQRADVLAAQARVDRAKADLAEAESRVQRAQQLLDKGAGTAADLDDAKLRRSTVKAQLGAATAEERAVVARGQAVSAASEATKIRAPFDGTILRKLAEVGEPLSPTIAGGATTGLLQIATLQDLEVQADVSEAQFTKVKPGTAAQILLDAFPDRGFRGEVSAIRPTVDRSKASVTVKVRFTDPTDGVFPDMAAKVSFLTKPIDDAAMQQKPRLVAPKDAVVERNGKKVILTLDAGRVREVPVTVQGEFGAMVELGPGPTTGTKVIRSPGSGLGEGSRVKERAQ